jgi:hypothetical protein
MCYFLYGAINDGINSIDYSRIDPNNHYHFRIGSKIEVIKSINRCDSNFRITSCVCDCETSLGSHKTGEKDLSDLSKLINTLRDVRGIKHIYLSKNWFNEKTKLKKQFISMMLI